MKIQFTRLSQGRKSESVEPQPSVATTIPNVSWDSSMTPTRIDRPIVELEEMAGQICLSDPKNPFVSIKVDVDFTIFL
jgi:hypothetical protein